jgi:GTP cyclohydrolase II
LKIDIEEIDFEKLHGVIPVVAQEYGSNQVLKVGLMNQEALDLTLKRQEAHYLPLESKSHQKVIDIQIDEKKESLLLIVEQTKQGESHFVSTREKSEAYERSIVTSTVANLPTRHGEFRVKAYRDGCQEHLAVMSQNFEELENPIVRVHSECLTGDALGSLKCDCNNQLGLALKLISKEGGLVIYHRQEGRNIGLVNKINAYQLQDEGFNTVEANVKLGFAEDERNYDAIGVILRDLGVSKMRLVTNNPRKIAFVESLGIEITQRVPAITAINKFNEGYLATKKEQLGHML